MRSMRNILACRCLTLKAALSYAFIQRIGAPSMPLRFAKRFSFSNLHREHKRSPTSRENAIATPPRHERWQKRAA